MPTIPHAYLDGRPVEVEEALRLRARSLRSKEPQPSFACPECAGQLKPFAQSRPTARKQSPAHFEHLSRDADCPLSHRERARGANGAKVKGDGKAATASDEGSEDDDQRAIQELLQAVPNRTECTQLLQARIGQGRFRQRVLELERSCRITGISDARFLIASHIKPWSRSNNQERLEGDNGLMLSPDIDHLFDKGFVTFNLDGTLRLSPLLAKNVADALGATFAQCAPRPLRPAQWEFMKYHRRRIFKRPEKA